MRMKHCKKYRLIGQKLIRTLPEFGDIAASGVKIAYIESYEEKKKNGKIIYADCAKVNERYRWCCKYDFFITVYEPNVMDFTEEQLEILIRHELHHVGVNFDGSYISYYLAPHDVEEFWDIINEHGLEWDKTD